MPMRLHFGYFSVDGCRAVPEAVFVFGDNLERVGKGGQAVIRDCPNAVGLASKIAPRDDDDAFFSDGAAAAFEDELRRFDGMVGSRLRAGATVWWPADGIGTGLSAMPERAPGLYARMCRYSRQLFEDHGDRRHVSAIVCGGRGFQDKSAAFAGLDDNLGGFAGEGSLVEVIEGGAEGADQLAGDWADERGHVHTRVSANSARHGARADTLRDEEMANRLQARRDQAGARVMVVGLPGGSGAETMLEISRRRGFDITMVG